MDKNLTQLFNIIQAELQGDLSDNKSLIKSLRTGQVVRGVQETIDSAWSILIGSSFQLSPDKYYALQNVTETVREEFSLVAAWKKVWPLLVTDEQRYSTGRLAEEIWIKAEPLATLLGTGYSLEIDVETIFGPEELISKESTNNGWKISTLPPVPYEEYSKIWPELNILPRLSLAARTLFIRGIRFAKARHGAVMERKWMGPFNIPELESGLQELFDAGLIDLEPNIADILGTQTVKTLKQYAFEHGLKARGPKHRLAEAIAAQIEHEKIKSHFRLDDKKYIRILVSQFPLLKKQVYAEEYRIWRYLNWVENPDVKPPSPPGSDPERHMKPNGRWDDEGTLKYWSGCSKTEIGLVRGIWDSKCDEIVQDLAEKYGCFAEDHISGAIAAYLSPSRLTAYKQKCDWDKYQVRGWDTLLTAYGEVRLIEMNVEARKPRLLTCKSCGIEFLEWSIPRYALKTVNYKVHFCVDCYSRAFWRDQLPHPDSMGRDEMLNRLAKLADKLGIVPSVTFFKTPRLELFPEEKQIAVIKLLSTMPSYNSYVNEFGTWLEALNLAGILEDGTERYSRGTRCLANDGHECLSLGEKAIDDWLNDRDIPHEREPLYPYHFRLNPSRMRGDWKVRNVFVEYAGLMDEPDYASKLETKQQLASEFGIDLIILHPGDIYDLDSKLVRLLKKKPIIRIEEVLQQAIGAIKAEQKEIARQQLAEVLRVDPRHEIAWLWMSAVVDSDRLRRQCLENVLVVNPKNEYAQRGLVALNHSTRKS